MPRPSPRLVCTDVRARNLARAIRFYRVLGLQLAAKGRMGDGTQIVWMQDPTTGQMLELYHLSPQSPLYVPYRPQSESSTSRVFSVGDVTPTLQRLRRLGHPVDRDFEDGEVRLTFLRDPDGALIELLSWTDKSRASHRAPPMDGLRLRRRLVR